MSSQQDELKQEGNAFVQKQEYEQAASIYTQALEINSTSEAAAAIFSNRSLCFLNIKKYSESLQDAEKAISLRPTWHRGYQRAAAACEKIEKHEEGLKHLDKCFELDEASKKDTTFKQMKEDFQLNIMKQRAPSMTQDALKKIGDSLVAMYQCETAIEFYTLAITKDAFCDAAVPILSNRSLCYFTIGKYKEAYEDGGCCCGIKPDWAKGFMRRGVAAEKLGEWQIALESYDEYLKLDPKDEAGVKSSRSAVAKVVADLKKAEDAKKTQREIFALDLEKTTDPNKLVEKSYAYLFFAADRFDIEGMKIALKQPCNVRFDTLFLMYEKSNFHPRSLASARKVHERFPHSDDISIVLADLFFVFQCENRFEKISVARQVEYLDFLLDVAEEQDFSAPIRDCKRFLKAICWYDPTSSKYASIRKDLVITLFNRIDTARKVFHGKNASIKEFASDLLYTLCQDFDPKRHELSLDADMTSDRCSQDLYECICTAIKHGADPNFHSWLEREISTLSSAVTYLRSVKVVELLLRHGADPNRFGFAEHWCGDEDEPGQPLTAQSSAKVQPTPTSPLSLAFCTHRPDIIRALLRCGAKIPTEKLPAFILKCLPPSKYPLVKPEWTSTFPNTLLVNQDGVPTARGLRLRSLINEEYIQLWFEVIERQNLSFVCCDVGGSFVTPLSLAIAQQFDLRLIETIIKLQPELVRQLTLPLPPHVRGPLNGHSPLGTLLHSTDQKAATVEYLQGVAKLLMDHGIDFEKDAAHCCFFQRDGSDNTFEALSGEALVDFMTRQGRSSPKLQMLKKFMMTKK